MSSYQLAIRFEPWTHPAAVTEAITGYVTVTAVANTTCGKIVLHWACPTGEPDGPFREIEGADLELARWAEWYAGQTYEYPFEFQPGPDYGCQLHVRPEIHIVGASEPDISCDWQKVGERVITEQNGNAETIRGTVNAIMLQTAECPAPNPGITPTVNENQARPAAFFTRVSQ